MGQESRQGVRWTAQAPNQRRVTGRTLITVGRTLRFLGFMVGAGGASLLGNAFCSDPGPDVERLHW